MKIKYPYLLTFFMVILLEFVVFLWANISVEYSDYVFEKCARNSGKASALINIILLSQLVHYGLKGLFQKRERKVQFDLLVFAFALNHLIHFSFILGNFNSKHLELIPAEHVHGVLSFGLILFAPVILGLSKILSGRIYFLILLYIVNSSLFIIKTFVSLISPERYAYFHQFAILVIINLLIGLIYRVYTENRINSTS